jgi:hypothetical protein
MRVSVESDADAAVPEPLGDHLGKLTSGTEGLLYCSKRCAQVQAQRDYRKRKREGAEEKGAS